MKKTVSILLTLLFVLACCAVSASAAENTKINPELEQQLAEMSADETAEVLVRTKYTMEFKSGYELTEYVNKKTREKLGIAFQINTTDDLDLWRKTYNSIMFEIESGNRKVVIEKLGLSDEITDQACNMLIAKLTKEQILAAAETDEVSYIEPYEETPFDDAPWELPIDDLPDEPLDPACAVGDADGDGMITVLDATRIQRALADLIPTGELNTVACDTDGDGSITILDATRIHRTLAFGDDEFYYDPEDGKYHYPGDEEGEIYYHDGKYYHYGYEVTNP